VSTAALRSGADEGEVLVGGLSGSSTVIAQLDREGNPDSGFGTEGVSREQIFSSPGRPALAPADNSKVFVAQLDPATSGGSSEVSVARLEEDGDLDGGVVAILLAQGLLALTLIATATKTALPDGGTLPGGPLRTAAGRLGIRRPRPKWGRWTVLALFSYYAIAIAYALLVVQPEQEDIARSLGLGSGVLTTLLAVFLIALAAPVSEEIFFRGMLFGGLRRNMGMIPAAAVSALVFGALHATTGVTAVPPLIVFGFILALLYERTGSLLPGMLGHAINNGLALALAT
jgi:membrane protease YdiL (CAAX protease family)